ncbi:hypothetical protein NA56DRAFT_565304, partial [Hyaloscypha hepaticicola]
IGHPVRSAIHKLQIGILVVGWVTTSEFLLLYDFFLVEGLEWRSFFLFFTQVACGSLPTANHLVLGYFP